MIHRVDIGDAEVAARILQLQRASYAVEAALIGFDGIPALHEGVESLRRCGETFHVEVSGTDIIGAVSWERAEDEVTICRLTVHPGFFRRGIARELLRYVMAENADASSYAVSTGALNVPAIELYRSFGFEEVGRREVAPSVFITRFLKRMRP